MQASIEDLGPRCFTIGVGGRSLVEAIEQTLDQLRALLRREPQRLLEHRFDGHEVTATGRGGCLADVQEG